MLTVTATGAVFHQVTSPLVYLDHWCLMDFAEEPAASARLSAALSRSGGTLAISWLNLSEFVPVGSRKTAEECEALIRAVWPNVAFIQVVPDPVIRLEDTEFKDSEQRTPMLDKDLFDHYLRRAMRSHGLNPWDPKGLITDLQNENLKARRKQHREVGLQASKKHYDAAMERYRTDAKYRRWVRAVPGGPVRRWPTKHLMEEVDHAAIRSGLNLFGGGNVDDLFHSIVPVSYCDLVVLDRANANRISALVKRLKSAGLVSRAARVFSKPTLPDFWNALETWTGASPRDTPPSASSPVA